MRARKSLVENRKIGGTKKKKLNSGRRSREVKERKCPKIGPNGRERRGVLPSHPHPLRIGLGLGPRAFWNGKKNKKWYDDVNARVILSNNVYSVWHNRQDLPVQMPQPHMAPTPALKYLQLPAGESSKELSLAQDTPREKVGGGSTLARCQTPEGKGVCIRASRAHNSAAG